MVSVDGAERLLVPDTDSDQRRPREGRDAFEVLYREMLPTVYRFTTARLGRSEGEDVASEVFHAAAIAFRDGRREQVTPAWLMAVARNKVIDRWRRAQRRSAIDLLHRSREEDLMEFPSDWSVAERRPAVMAALERMKPRHRNLLLAHYVDGIPAPELAETLDTSVSAVESALARARHSFKKLYEGQERS
jgi:RNA polymerase sigma-70 factor (ECF subfamily)